MLDSKGWFECRDGLRKCEISPKEVARGGGCDPRCLSGTWISGSGDTELRRRGEGLEVAGDESPSCGKGVIGVEINGEENIICDSSSHFVFSSLIRVARVNSNCSVMASFSVVNDASWSKRRVSRNAIVS